MGSRFPNRILPYVLLFPSIIIVVVFLIVPTIQTFYLSLFKVSPFGDRRIYEGLANFTRLFSEWEYLSCFIVTMITTSFIVLVGLTISLAIAMMANLKISNIGIYRTALIWPYALSPAAAGTIWLLLFDPSTGALIYLLSCMTGSMYNWVNDEIMALLMINITATWKMLGYNIIFFLAGLQNIPKELMEAADIDGASHFKRFMRVTLPLLSPTAFFLLVANSLYGFFEIFGIVDIMTQGGPQKATSIMVYRLYEDGFHNMQMGLASAQSIVLFIFVIILTGLQFRYAQRLVFYQ